MQKTAARRAAVFLLFPDNRKGGSQQPPPPSGRGLICNIWNILLLLFRGGEEMPTNFRIYFGADFVKCTKMGSSESQVSSWRGGGGGAGAPAAAGSSVPDHMPYQQREVEMLIWGSWILCRLKIRTILSPVKGRAFLLYPSWRCQAQLKQARKMYV